MRKNLIFFILIQYILMYKHRIWIWPIMWKSKINEILAFSIYMYIVQCTRKVWFISWIQRYKWKELSVTYNTFILTFILTDDPSHRVTYKLTKQISLNTQAMSNLVFHQILFRPMRFQLWGYMDQKIKGLVRKLNEWKCLQS